jgi:hypothetical protein
MDERYFIETKRSYSGIVLFAIYIVIFSFFKHENFNYSSWYPMVLITNICFLLLTNYKKFVNNLSNAAFTIFMMSIISIDIIAIIFALNSISITFSPFQIGSFTIRNDEFHLIWLVLFISKSLYFLYVVYMMVRATSFQENVTWYWFLEDQTTVKKINRFYIEKPS